MKPTISEVILLVREYYKDNPCGGSLHIALDDGNLEDDCIRYCLEYAYQNHDSAGVELAKILLRMSLKQRDSLYTRYSEYAYYSIIPPGGIILPD
jgi:hypothetical protein